MTHPTLRTLSVLLIAGVLATSSDAQTPPPSFSDAAKAWGLDFTHRSGPTLMFNPEAIGPGVAMIDFDGDGLPDVLFVNGGEVSPDGTVRHAPDRLFRNLGGGHFEDVTGACGLVGAGIGNGAAVADRDNDGYPDVHLTGFRENLLYASNGDGTFSPRPLFNLKHHEFSASSAWGDYNRDGLLDLYVASYHKFDYRGQPSSTISSNVIGEPIVTTLSPLIGPAQTNVLHRARGDGTYETVTRPSRAGNNELDTNRAMGVVFTDLDDDGWPDLVVASDNGPVALLHNAHDGTFESVARRRFLVDTRGNMGIAVGDPDGDGHQDLFLTHFDHEHNELYRWSAAGYRAVGEQSGLQDSDWRMVGWGCAFLDYDADGLPDLIVANGHLWPEELKFGDTLSGRLKPTPQPVQLFHDEDGKKFRELTNTAFRPPLAPTQGRGLAVGDLDGDGLPDVLIAVNNGPALALRDVAPQAGRSAWVELCGTRSNRGGIGARLRTTLARTGAPPYVIDREVRAGNGYMSTDAPAVHLGLGPAAASSESLSVRWPSGLREAFPLPRSRSHFRLVEGEGTPE